MPSMGMDSSNKEPSEKRWTQMAAVWCPPAGARYAFVCCFVIISSLFFSLLLLHVYMYTSALVSDIFFFSLQPMPLMGQWYRKGDPEPFQSPSRAVSEQFQSRFRAVSEQLPFEDSRGFFEMLENDGNRVERPNGEWGWRGWGGKWHAASAGAGSTAVTAVASAAVATAASNRHRSPLRWPELPSAKRQRPALALDASSEVSEQFQSSFRAVSEQFQSSFRAVLNWLIEIDDFFTGAVSEQFQSGFRAVPEQFQSSFRAVSDSFLFF